MSDFSEIESELKKLRPVDPSAEFLARLEKAKTELESEPDNVIPFLRFRWLAGGIGLAAAALVLLFIRINSPDVPRPRNEVAASPAPTAGSTIADVGFVPVGATQVVYHQRDEGLHYQAGSEQPVRRLRSHTRETLRWRNPDTGASLLVSYPSEQVQLIPVSGQ
jgi:hypothetical protein